jgi:hypothetical protein
MILLHIIMEGPLKEIHGQNNHFRMVYYIIRHPLTYGIRF